VRRIIASEGITLDGYFADPQGEIAWQTFSVSVELTVAGTQMPNATGEGGYACGLRRTSAVGGAKSG
jgi:hypothetical protein